jgi:MoaA/NifB/PqqE/SkfB family radical SAM enzyme
MMLKYCSSPFDTVNIHAPGLVGLCLCSGWHTQGFIGDLRTQSLKEIFKSKAVQEFRDTIFTQTFQYCNTHTCGKIWNLESVPNFDRIDKHPTLPTNIQLHLDKNCTLKCPSCRNKNIYSPDIHQPTKHILEVLSRDYADFDQRVFVYADAYGDVFASSAYQQFLRGNNIPKCFKFCFTTNGNLLTKNLDLLTKLKDQIDIVNVSLDSATDDTYKDVRGGKFNILLDGIKQCIELGITVSSQFVVQYRNYKEILDYVILAKNIGITHIGFQCINRWPHMSDSWWDYNQIDNNPNVDYKFLVNALIEIKNDPQCGINGGLESIIYNHSHPLQIEQS